MQRRTFLQGLLALPAAAVAGLPEVAKPVAKALPVTPFVERDLMHQTYALGFRVTHEMIEDDQWPIIEQMSQDLVQSLRNHQDRRFS